MAALNRNERCDHRKGQEHTFFFLRGSKYVVVADVELDAGQAILRLIEISLAAS